MRERAAQELNPEMGRMGAEDPPRVFRSAPLTLAGRLLLLTRRQQTEDDQAEEGARGDDQTSKQGPVAGPRLA
jgi:hypothetical protein